ncbi:MAG: DUF3352 domain-containing protein [Candidatus Eremiobacteraeota bacterium]|nr:DUF3352 domain-containing protein [Candidatus Eremiobacteraeota bacterium]
MTENSESDVRAEVADQQPEKKGGSGSIIAIILILIIIGGLAYFFLFKKKGVTGPEMGSNLDLVPQKCSMFIQFDTGKLDDQKMKDDMWTKIKDSQAFKEAMGKLKEENVDLEEDVLSWIGEQVSVSYLEPPGTAKTAGMKRDAKNDHFILIIGLKDKAKAEEKLKELREKGKAKFTEEKYEGVTIWNPDKEKTPSMAFVKGMLVLGNQPEDIKKSIDTANKKNPSIKENKDFTSVLEKLPARSAFLMYMNLAELAAAEAAKSKQIPRNPEAEKLQKSLQGFGFGIAVKKGDIVGQGFIGLDKNSESGLIQGFFAARPTMGAPESAKLFPKDTTYYNAFDAKVAYNAFMKLSEGMPGGSVKMEENKKQMKATMGVDLDKDIIENFAGEMALSIDFTNLMQFLMKGPASRMQNQPSQEARILTKIANDLTKHSMANNDKLPAKLEDIAPGYMKMFPPAPAGMEYYYVSEDDTGHFLIGYTSDGSNVSSKYPKYDSDLGLQGEKSTASAPKQQAPPIVLAIKVKDKDKMKEVLGKIIKKQGPMFKKEEYKKVDILGNPQLKVCVFKDFFLMGMGLGANEVKTIIDNDMAEDKSLASDPNYKKIKGKLGPNTLGVQMVKFEKILPALELASAFAPTQDPGAQESKKALLEAMKKYDSLWTFSEATNDGIKFEFIVIEKE